MDAESSDSALLALLIVDGVLLGALAVAFNPLYVGPAPVPLGAVASLLVVPWLVLRAGDVDPRPGWAGAPAFAWFVTIGVLGLTGPGGDFVLAGTWQPIVLLAAGIGGAVWAMRQVARTR